MKFYSFLMVFLAMTMSGSAVGHEDWPDLNLSSSGQGDYLQNLNPNWIGQEAVVSEVEDSCDMRGRACSTYFYWQGYAFWLLEGSVYEGSKMTLVDATDVSNRNLLRFNFLDEDSNLIRAKLVYYYKSK